MVGTWASGSVPTGPYTTAQAVSRESAGVQAMCAVVLVMLEAITCWGCPQVSVKMERLSMAAGGFCPFGSPQRTKLTQQSIIYSDSA